METRKNVSYRKIQYQKVSFDMKLSIIDEITNGQISINQAVFIAGGKSLVHVLGY